MHLYIHIPFCKQACFYCDFHFSTNLKYRDQIVTAIAQEIITRKTYLPNAPLETIYFGGGTPSLLSHQNLKILFSTIKSNFEISKDAEITLEANPDDLTKENLELWYGNGINRLSLGIQSFNEAHLKFMNRAHTAIESLNAIDLAKETGFNKFSIDLIYGVPSNNHDIWQNDLKIAIELNVDHVSAYNLSIEPNTVFGVKTNKGQMKPLDDEFSIEQFKILRKNLLTNGFEHYEISNFAQNKKYAVHNTSYWQDKPYLGVGPSAHSYNQNSRQFNISNNKAYLKGIEQNKPFFEVENLSLNNKANDYILTSLRTQWGLQLDTLKSIKKDLDADFLINIKEFTKQGFLIFEDNTAKLTEEGMLMADQIASDLFFV